MKRRLRFLKFAAFIPAIVLVGGFIGCRTGMFEVLSNPPPAPQTPSVAPVPESDKRPAIMGGSKSPGPVGIAPPSAPATQQQSPVPTQPVAQPPANAPAPNKPPAIMFSTKSAEIIFESEVRPVTQPNGFTPNP